MAGPDFSTSFQQQATNALWEMVKSMQSWFPGVTATSTVAPSSAGGITFSSSQPSGFALVTLSSGVTVKIPYYPQ